MFPIYGNFKCYLNEIDEILEQKLKIFLIEDVMNMIKRNLEKRHRKFKMLKKYLCEYEKFNDNNGKITKYINIYSIILLLLFN